MTTLLPDIKKAFWDYILKFLNSKNFDKAFLSSTEGSSILNLMHTNDKISKYQWYYISDGYPIDLLCEHIIHNFLFCIKLYADSKNLRDDFSEANDLKVFFDDQFEKLENEILLSDAFNYIILIPLYRVNLPSTMDEIELDTDHRIKNIDIQESPYGQWNFKAIPQSWDKGQERAADASFEANFSIKKRLAEDFYNMGNIPMERFYILKNDVFNQKIYSIFDFFLCYGPSSQLGTLTIGDKCFIKTPPFFQEYSHLIEKSLRSEFPAPITFLELNLSKEDPRYHNYVELWKNHYIDFYNNFYKDPLAQEKNDIFKYTLEVLRNCLDIPYDKIQCFLLISTFEGLMYHEKIYDKLNSNMPKYALSKPIEKGNKKVPCIKAFLEVCEDQMEYWQHIFYNKYPMGTEITDFKTKGDLECLLDHSFKYRNNIAHPEKVKPINLKEEYFYESQYVEKISVLIHFIQSNFPFFLAFLLRTWLKKGFKNKDEWYNYILNLI